MAKQERLDTPGRRSQWIPRVRVSDDAFGDFAESAARFMGTGRFIVWMTVFIVLWIVTNQIAPGIFNDGFPFIFLTLLLSLQASYAAPLILLAGNRQEARDRVSMEHDREVAAQSRADMDFLAREIASLRARMNDVATRDFIRSELKDLLSELEQHEEPEAGKAKLAAED
ncbi:MAG: DUF1003 domain-containing protein [Propionicimonas sp.]|uniref:DUF1003 domain-containing protein n=1 Tax=Propionicimonas sp. TaxID=1955623 RepID=UPI002B1F885B|nr:DUF1003 domain-containing protein [Propionicimonas sp.]MEA4944255.1 DUF1003 domain-containing protein [Propionicimonas sp.]MEA5053025.1 DUF1003 domain-containing protein [Propionicimonas sp.]MEA5116651.1 DUF1003 domain-containing protein [Propionicimonas sp.]